MTQSTVVKMSEFRQTMGIINRILKPFQGPKHNGLKTRNTLELSTLLYGSKFGQLDNRITSGEIKFIIRRTAKYTWITKPV
jgi:hypothetical protein